MNAYYYEPLPGDPGYDPEQAVLVQARVAARCFRLKDYKGLELALRRLACLVDLDTPSGEDESHGWQSSSVRQLASPGPARSA